MKKNLIYSSVIAALLIAGSITKSNSQSWSLTGNAGTNGTNNFIGTTDNVALKIRTNNSVRITVASSGRVGIGNVAPKSKLDVNGGTGVADTLPVINGVTKKTGALDYVGVAGTSVTGDPGFGIGVSGTGNNAGVFGSGGTFGVFADGGSYGVWAQSEGIADTTSATGFEADGIDAIGGSGNFSLGVYAQGASGRFNTGIYAVCGPTGTPADSDNTHSNWAGQFIGDIVYSRAFRFSDAKLKNNIQPITSALDKLNQIQTSTYTFRRSEYPQLSLPSSKQIGFIAENMEKVFPELVTETRTPKIIAKNGKIGRESATFKTVDYEGVLPVVVAAIKEQKAIVDAKDAQISDLNTKLNALESRLAALETSKGSDKLSSSTVSGSGLEQNNPNPFSQSTVIRYSIPANSSAQIVINGSNGSVLKSYSVKSSGQITINANELSSGTYTYSLLINGNVVDTKSLVLTK